MSGFNDYSVTRDLKRLPIDGHVFEFPDRISAEAGEVLLRVHNAAVDAGENADPERVFEAAGIDPAQVHQAHAELLGDAHAELIAEGLSGALERVVQTLTAWHVFGQKAAESAWNGLGPTTPPNRAARRQSATARSTRLRASTTGTSSRKPSRAAARPGESS